jgi:hypothetical protein
MMGIRRSLDVLFTPGDVIELRVLYSSRRTDSGYFADFDAAATAAEELDGRGPIYVTMNRVHPALLARARNRMREYARETTSDHDIVRIRHVLFDFDPERPAGISSSDEEHAAALARAEDCRQWLIDRGAPEGALIIADSGNGAHVLLRTDLPNDADHRALVARCTEAVAFRCAGAGVGVDLKTVNPARITKCYGTLAAKGDDTPDRPHRRSGLLVVPQALTAVSADFLALNLAILAPVPPQPERGARTAFDLDAWLEAHTEALGAYRVSAWQGGRKIVFAVCPFDPTHTNESAYIVQFPSGAVAAGCHHNGCIDKDWHALRDLIEPGWRARRARREASPEGAERAASDLPPWSDAVDGAQLVCEVEALFTDYLVLPPGAALVLATWTIGTWAYDLFDAYPYLAITSAVRRCAKTRLLELLLVVCRRALPVTNISEAALYRAIDKESPTVLIDEAQHLRERSERSAAIHDILAAGFRRSMAYVWRVAGANRDELRRFTTYCPKAIGLIGKLSDVLADRSIEIRMKRRLPEERVNRKIQAEVERRAVPLRQQITRWVADHLGELVDASASGAFPAWLEDREAELWQPLLALCRIAAPTRVESLETTAGRSGTEKAKDMEGADSTGVRLLRDIQACIFTQDDQQRVFLPTGMLLAQLKGMEDAPWGDWKDGRALSARVLASLLRAFEIWPEKTVYGGRKGTRGYFKAAFLDAWQRYTREQAAEEEAAAGAAGDGGDATPPEDGGPAPHGGSESAVEEPSHADPSTSASEPPTRPQAEKTRASADCEAPTPEGGKSSATPSGTRPWAEWADSRAGREGAQEPSSRRSPRGQWEGVRQYRTFRCDACQRSMLDPMLKGGRCPYCHGPVEEIRDA